MIRVLHVITGLDTGGAEMMLYKLLSRTNRNAFAPEVVSLTGDGPVGTKIAALGIPVASLGMGRRSGIITGMVALGLRLRRNRPDILQTWMYHADLLGGLSARMAGGVAVVWDIQAGTLDPRHVRPTTMWTARACARTSGWLPDRIVCCAEAVLSVHVALGYRESKMLVIHNGFDVDQFKPDTSVREATRRELGLADESVLIGMVARFDPQKDHRNFIEAAFLLHRERRDVAFVLCGDRVTWDNPELAGSIESAGMRAQFHLLGRRDDVPRICAALDVASLSSFYGEGFPNAIGEAMACAVPCVVTDVGGCASLVGSTGRVVPAQNPGALAGAWKELVEMGAEGRRRLGAVARRRIEERFSISAVVAEYEGLYKGLAEQRRRLQATSVD